MKTHARIHEPREESGSALVLALIVLSTVVTSAPVGDASATVALAQEEERGVDALTLVLLHGRRSELDAETLTRNLVREGPYSIARLFEVLERGRFRVKVGEHGNATKPLTPAERAALLDVLGRHPREEVQRFLSELLLNGPDEHRRLAALLVLGAHGNVRDLPTLLAFVLPEEEGARVSRPLRAGFGAALGGILDNDPTAPAAVGSLYDEAPRSLVPSLLRALGDRPSRASLTVLGTLLGRLPAADALVLAELGHVAKVVNDPVDPEVQERVRAYLGEAHATTRAEAIVACGHLEDFAAAPALIEVMETGEANERRLAHEALGDITHKVVAADPEAWAVWYEAATQWRSTQVPVLLERVRSGPPEQASRAILELSKRHHLRHELAPRLAPGLEREEQDLVLLTCAALGHLASPLAVPPLLASLEDERLEVRRAAFLALCRITGEDHGEASRDWAAAGW